MTSLERAEAALDRAEKARDQAVIDGAEVHRRVGYLSEQLEQNHFSVRLARAFGLEDPRR